ncbi:MAG TPA: phosphoribosyltransferase family protein, partial [Acidobacteriota bacterium]|nr:phosphoribosyltransferase family protein [Acidobacteriota bacterium]
MTDQPPGTVAQQILISEGQLRRRVEQLGKDIARDFQGKQPLFVCVLRGAVVFHSDLIRAVDLELTIDFISVSSYGEATDSSGEVRLVKDLETSIHGRDVILVEDIVDT